MQPNISNFIAFINKCFKLELVGFEKHKCNIYYSYFIEDAAGQETKSQ